MCIRARSRSRPRIYTRIATLLAGCREVKFGNQRGRKARGREASEASCSAQRRLPVCWLRGKVRTRVFLRGWNFCKGLRAGNSPHKGGVGSSTESRSRGRLYTHAHSHSPPRVRTPGFFGLVETWEEGAQGRDPGLCRARPSAPAISAGRSAGTRTPSPAAPSTAKKRVRALPLRRSQTPGRSPAWRRPSQGAGAGGLRPAPAFVTLNLQITKSLGPAGCGS